MANAKTPPKTKRNFNLLKPYKAPPTAWDKVYDWLINKARVVMLVSEVAVAISFVGKVVVDVQAKNLDDAIKGKVFELSQYAPVIEPNLRQIQQKANVFTNIWEASSGYSDVLKEIYSYVPNPAADLSIRIAESDVTITGGDSLEALSQIEAKMKASATFVSSETKINLNSEGSAVQQGKYLLVTKIAKVNNRTKLTVQQ
jgi:hypothetical protein